MNLIYLPFKDIDTLSKNFSFTTMRLILPFILFATLTFGQKSKDYLVSYTDATSGAELIGFKDRFGKIVIKPTFTSVSTDTLYSMAIVQKNWEWTAVDKKGEFILKPFIYDNGPDYMVEGLFRFVDNNKIGFANSDGKKVIPAKYDFAEPFANGLSEYALGGHREYDKGGELWWWTGAYENGFVNHFGQEFIKVTELKNNKREAWTKDKKHFLLNKQGHIIKQLK